MTVLSVDQFISINEAILLAENHSKNKSHLIEEFVEGQLYSHSAFIENGRIKYDFIVEEHCNTNPFTVDSSWVVPNDDFIHLSEIRFQIELLSRNLSLCDGLVHTQFMLDGEEIWILEVTRRCPGDLYSRLIELSTEVQYSKIFTNYFLKRREVFEVERSEKNIFRHTVSFNNDQHLISFRLSNELKIVELVPLFLSGQLIKSSPNGKAGIIFLNLESSIKRSMVLELIKKNLLFL